MSNFAFIPLLQATGQTLYMVFIASFVGIFLGLIGGIFLFLTQKDKPLENLVFYRVFGLIVNIGRSIPFIILLISIIPFTRLIIGSAIGINAAVVPLALTAFPFFARIAENALSSISTNLIETGNALGATTTQIIYKILIPEAKPALVKGATLTIIALIGYSAMAGVVGGGGLGELAINYGYQQFNIVVMLETVILLVVLVQCIQMLGDYLATRLKIRWLLVISGFFWLLCIFTQINFSSASSLPTVRVGIISGPQEQIMHVAQQVAKNDYHFNIKLVVFSDYQLPNQALNAGEIDANIFQHLSFLQIQIKQHHYQLVSIAKTFLYPFGFYSKQISTISQLKSGAVVAIPNDATNEARALLILKNHGLIDLKTHEDMFSATPYDIIKNPMRLQIKTLDAAQLPRVMNDAVLVGLTNDYVSAAGLTLNDALIKESSDSPYANLIVVRQGTQNNPIFQQLIAVMHSDEVTKATQKVFSKDGAIPAWKNDAAL
jgi:D-methionine transport system substrate-binding protein